MASRLVRVESVKGEAPVVAVIEFPSVQRTTRSAASGLQVQEPERHGGRRRLKNTRFAAAVPPCKLGVNEALQRRPNKLPLVGCYAELGVDPPEDD